MDTTIHDAVRMKLSRNQWKRLKRRLRLLQIDWYQTRKPSEIKKILKEVA